MIPLGPANAENSFELGCISRQLPAAAQLAGSGCSCEVQPSALPSSLPSLLPGPSSAIAPATNVSGVKNKPKPHPSYAEHAKAARVAAWGTPVRCSSLRFALFCQGPQAQLHLQKGSLSQIHASLTSLAISLSMPAAAWLGVLICICAALFDFFSAAWGLSRRSTCNRGDCQVYTYVRSLQTCAPHL